MRTFARSAVLCLLSGIAVLAAGCGGGGGNGGGGGGGNNPTTPTVTVAPGKTSIATSDALQVTVSVSGTSGTATGSVKVTGGGYTSSSATLSGGSAVITIPANSLPAGSMTLTGSYTPDSASSSKYNSASAAATVTVTGIVAPTVTLTPSTNSISVALPLQVTVSVAGGSGSATPTGIVTLTGGAYTSAAATLSNGSATISIPAASLAVGSVTLTATYAPDTAATSAYKTSSGTALVSVTVASPTVRVTPASSSIGTGQALSVTVAVAGFAGGSPPTGSVTLTASGGYSSGAKALDANGSTVISIPAGSMAAGSATLTASYSPDTAGATLYGGASKSATVTVTAQATPTITVSPSSQTLNTSQSLNVTVTVNPLTGHPTPTGSVVVSSGTGSYQSTAVPLAGGSATITIPAYKLVFGSVTLSAAYTPDTASTGVYTNSTGSATVTVARTTPTVTVTPASLNINTGQSLDVTVLVAGPGAGAPATTGTVKLTSGAYASATTPLTNGSATITIAAGAVPAGSLILTAAYTADGTSSPLFNSATGASAAVTVITLSTITVNESAPIAQVTDQLLGMNLAAWYDVVGNAASINTAFGKAGIKAIRWPGGSWSDGYHWGYQTGSSSLIQPYQCSCTTDANTGVTQCTPNSKQWAGYSAFAQFVSAIPLTGSYDLAMTANYGVNETCNGGGDPNEAAAWLNAAIGDGITVSHMTVGNEGYGKWENDLHTIAHDPTTYANSVIGANGFYQLIKAASPTTKVGVVLDAGSIQSAWDSTVLSTAKNYYDFVEYHIYPKNPGQEDDTFLVHSAAQDLTSALNKIKTEMTTAGVNVPIYVGEMGSVSSNPGKQSWSITQGLYAGQTMGEMMNAGVVRATWWIGFGNCNADNNGNPLGNLSSSLYGWQTFGAYNVFSDGPTDGPCGTGSAPIGTMSPTARAFQLFSNIAVNGEHALSTTVNGDMTNIRAYSATHNGGTALFLFNLNQNQSMPVTVTFSTSTHSSGVTVITYDKAIYDQSNPANAGGVKWGDPTTSDLGAKDLPLTLTLTPWSMNVVILKP
jgi:hypothetical protein